MFSTPVMIGIAISTATSSNRSDRFGPPRGNSASSNTTLIRSAPTTLSPELTTITATINPTRARYGRNNATIRRPSRPLPAVPDPSLTGTLAM
jgi:hypothetical protein